MKYLIIILLLLTGIIGNAQISLKAKPIKGVIKVIPETIVVYDIMIKDSNWRIVAYKKKDSAMVILDSGACIRILYQASMETSKYFKEEIKRTYAIVTRWTNVVQWIRQDYNISENDFMLVLNKRRNAPVNLNNKHYKKNKL